MDLDILGSIGGMLGSMCKVDPITVNQSSGRYARICVEIDISKPLISSLIVEDISISVEYENLGLISFSCRRYGHSKDNCKEGLDLHKKKVHQAKEDSRKNVKEAGPFGPWMLVSYDRNGKNQGAGGMSYKSLGNAGSFGKANISNRSSDTSMNNGTMRKNIGGQSWKAVTVARSVGSSRGGSRGPGSVDRSKDGLAKRGGSKFEVLKKDCEDALEVDLQNQNAKALIHKENFKDITNRTSKAYTFLSNKKALSSGNKGKGVAGGYSSGGNKAKNLGSHGNSSRFGKGNS
ncbi:hypothetical protein ACOSQ3_014007 [Xanthoceras sorbifolium]